MSRIDKITKPRLFWTLLVLALSVLALDFAGRALGWSHSGMIFGIQAFLGFFVLWLLAGFVWIVRFFIGRKENYYNDLRDNAPIIETPVSDWVQEE